MLCRGEGGAKVGTGVGGTMAIVGMSACVAPCRVSASASVSAPTAGSARSFLCGEAAGRGVARLRLPATQRSGAAVRRAAVAISTEERPPAEFLAKFQMHANDAGSTAVQVARLSWRIALLTKHLGPNKEDYSTQRGLQRLLGQRRNMLNYLYKSDRTKYDMVVEELGIRAKPPGKSGL